jgi:hypothetical protein
VYGFKIKPRGIVFMGDPIGPKVSFSTKASLDPVCGLRASFNLKRLFKQRWVVAAKRQNLGPLGGWAHVARGFSRDRKSGGGDFAGAISAGPLPFNQGKP